jgi:hypothetical protein
MMHSVAEMPPQYYILHDRYYIVHLSRIKAKLNTFGGFFEGGLEAWSYI